MKSGDQNNVPLALIAAAATPAFIIAIPVLIIDKNPGAILVWIIAFGFALVPTLSLGLPAFLLLKRLGWTQWWISLMGGFGIGAASMAFYSWPRHASNVQGSYSAWDGHKMVTLQTNGVPTTEGWVQYIHSVCGIGLLGMVSGFVAWLVWSYVPCPSILRFNDDDDDEE